MLGKTMIVAMYHYNHLTNNRLLDLAGRVTAEKWDAPQEAGQRSLHETAFHMVVEDEWLHLVRHGEPIWDQLPASDYPDVRTLRAFSDAVYAQYNPYVEGLTDEQLVTTVTGMMPDDEVRTWPVWYLLVHMLYHSAQHRSEMASMLTRQVCSWARSGTGRARA